jgi:hypothetical protein
MNLNARAPIRANNDNFGAEFLLPELFVSTYMRELLEWAQHLQRRGPFLMVRLWNRPGATILDTGYQPEVKLRCDALGNPATGAMKFVIQPDKEQDAAAIRKHCEVLPEIIRAQQAAAQADRGKRKSMARWVFDGTIPEYFVHRYQTELRLWAANFAKIGVRKRIVLREGTLSDLSPNEEQGAVLLAVDLIAKIDRKAGDDFEICASVADEQSEMLIRKHCEKLERAGISPRAVLKEPERPWLPFMPSRLN